MDGGVLFCANHFVMILFVGFEYYVSEFALIFMRGFIQRTDLSYEVVWTLAIVIN